jgi:hypothetical protein
MQHFIDGFVAQCRRHDLRAELLLVEWNPPIGRKLLIDELKWPSGPSPCEIRIITVPRELHERLPHGDHLPLFQMIAKNVGIRRARGQFVLATNIDILFSDGAIRIMRDSLRPGHLYRADRYDVPTDVPSNVPFDDVLECCRQKAFRVHATGFTLVRRQGAWYPRSPWHAILGVVLKAIGRDLRRTLSIFRERVRRLVDISRLGESPQAKGRRRIFKTLMFRVGADLRAVGTALNHIYRSNRKVLSWIYSALIRRQLFTNACGDFTLLSKADWFLLGGYPEWPMYSWHLDSVIVYQANRNGIKEIYLGKNAPIYHIEHEPGSGFTPESSDQLFARLKSRGIPYLDWTTDVLPMIEQMDRDRAAGLTVRYNREDWGYCGIDFPESSPGTARMDAANA